MCVCVYFILTSVIKFLSDVTCKNGLSKHCSTARIYLLSLALSTLFPMMCGTVRTQHTSEFVCATRLLIITLREGRYTWKSAFEVLFRARTSIQAVVQEICKHLICLASQLIQSDTRLRLQRHLTRYTSKLAFETSLLISIIIWQLPKIFTYFNLTLGGNELSTEETCSARFTQHTIDLWQAIDDICQDLVWVKFTIVAHWVT